MTRTYTKSRRADNQAETRQKIIEAAMTLHGEIGPTATTISMIAERAGVQRHTVYAHFADELSLLMACSGLHLEQNPPPTPAQWEMLNDPEARLSVALTALYGWFAQNRAMIGNVMRDAETNERLREVSDLRFGVPIAAMAESLSPGLSAKARSALRLAMSFYSWRTLTEDAGMKAKDAVALMVAAILGAGR